MTSGCCDEPAEKPEEDPQIPGIPSGLNWIAKGVQKNRQRPDSDYGSDE